MPNDIFQQLTKEETAAIVVSSTMIFGAIMILAFTLFFYVRLRNKRAHEKLQQKMQKASNLERMRRESKFPN
jgi:preprotein translocase subunit YajC